MPLYDYQCKNCRAIAEVRHGVGDVYAEACAQCGGVMARVFNPAGIVFKGSGFYITDSRKSTGDGSATGTGTAPAAPAAPATGNAPAAGAVPAASPASAPAAAKASDAA